MRTYAMSLFAAGAMLAACSDPSGTGQVIDSRAPGQVVVVTSTTGPASSASGYEVVVDSLDSHPIGLTDSWQLSVQPGRHTVTLRGISDYCAVSPRASLAIDVPPDSSVEVRFNVSCTTLTGVVQTAVTPVGPDLSSESYGVTIDGDLRDSVMLHRPSFIALPIGDHVISVQHSPHCAVVSPESTAVAVGNPLDTVRVEFPVTCTVPPEKAGTVRITASVSGFVPDGTRFPIWYSHRDPWSYGEYWIPLDSLTPGEATVVRLEASNVDPDHALYWFKLVDGSGRCDAGQSRSVEVPLGDTLDIALPVRCPDSPWDY